MIACWKADTICDANWSRSVIAAVVGSMRLGRYSLSFASRDFQLVLMKLNGI